MGDIVGDLVDGERVQRPEYALKGVHGRFQITEAGRSTRVLRSQ